MRQPLVLAALAAVLLSGTAMAEPLFNRIATFSVPQNLPADRDPKKKTVSEIIAANGDGTLLAADADRWLERAEDVPGSWWPAWMDWLGEHAGRLVAAPKSAGSRKHKPIEAAPGRYVKAKAP